MNYRVFVLAVCAMVAGACYEVKNASPMPIKNVIEVAGRQGVSCDGDYYYVSGSTALYKYSMKGNLVLSNESPFESLKGTPAPNHIGDIDVYDSEVYACCEYFNDGVAQNIQIAIYDAATLAYKRSIVWNADSGQVECCGIAVDRTHGIVFLADWVNGSYLYCYNKKTGDYVGKVHLKSAPANQQGIFLRADGRLLITSDDGDADKGEVDHIYFCNPFTDNKLKEEASASLFMSMEAFRRAGEIEGLCMNPHTGALIVLNNRGARIVNGMPVGFYKGYDKEIHELYVF